MVQVIPDKLLGLLKEPRGGNDAEVDLIDGGLKGRQTGEVYKNVHDVPSLFDSPDEAVTNKIKMFYEQNPFPSYEGLQDYSSLVSRGLSNPFSRKLLDSIGFNKYILECGCGTGQLSNFLQLNNNFVLGIDICAASLKLAIEHKVRNDLARVAFVQMNIFELALKDESFDVVISHGVLHHTYDARGAFEQIIRKLKPNGIVVVGLYNKPARFPSWVRSKLIKVFGPNIDYVVRKQIRDPRKAQIWINDQYFNPHETWHSIDEVLGWFSDNGIEYLNCVPAILGDGEDERNVFEPRDPKSKIHRWTTQMSWMASSAREGALFDLIGRKRA